MNCKENFEEIKENMVLVDDETIGIDLLYPTLLEHIKYIEVGLSCVRAADNIRISYDYFRDGWKIEQASIFEWEIDDKICDHDWKEVAFVKAWQRDGNNKT